MGLFFKNRTAFSFLNEADDDMSDTAAAETDATDNEAPSPEESGDDDMGSDDDFNIDTSLDDEGGEDGGETDSMDGTDDGGSSDSSSDLDSGSSGDDEPVEANTDIFASLTAEEQQIKIKELQNLFGNLYTSTDDILAKINALDQDEDSSEVISRMSMTLYSLRDYIREYMTTSFSRKSYLENDITFNRFLSILNSVSVIIDDLYKMKQDKNNK